VHVHDIFLPRDYPKQWVAGMRRFWTEQHLLHAFLLFNDAIEVLWSGNLMYARHLPELRAHLPRLPGLTDRRTTRRPASGCAGSDTPDAQTGRMCENDGAARCSSRRLRMTRRVVPRRD
jgi:hypothetical protein